MPRYTKENPAILKRYDKIFFGKQEKGNMVGDVIRRNPKFIIWCHENLDWVRFTDDVIAEAKGKYHTVTPKEIYDEVTKAVDRDILDEPKPWCATLVERALYNQMQEQYNNYWADKIDETPYVEMQEQYTRSLDKVSIFTKIKNRIYAKIKSRSNG